MHDIHRWLLLFVLLAGAGCATRGAEPTTVVEVESTAEQGPKSAPEATLVPNDEVSTLIDAHTQLDPEARLAADWVAGKALAFDTVEAGGDLSDLAPLAGMIGDARIVALGEGTHGSREFFQMKHRLIEYLARELGFTIFSIEANMPEAYQVDEYVTGGEGDPAALIGGMYFWTWNTESVLDMVEWMRAYNASGEGRIAFTGFDMQTPTVAQRIVQDFVKRYDPDFRTELNDAYALARRTDRDASSFGLASARFPVEAAAGKTIRFHGHIKTVGLENGWAGLWWRADGPGGETLAFDNMQGRGPSGTTDWSAHEIELEIPEETVGIYFGVLMPGRGTAWFDDLGIDIDGEPYDSDGTFDFSFEGDRLQGLRAGNTGQYSASLAVSAAKSGKKSLQLRSTQQACDGCATVEEALEAVEAVHEHLIGLAEQGDASIPEAALVWAIQNARVVVQELRGHRDSKINERDLAMAENLRWILEQDPEARVVIWAHNWHVGRYSGSMGQHLAEWYGADYVPVGFATRSGEYYAMGGGSGSNVHALQAPVPGSVEQVLAAVGTPRLILDLRSAVEDPAGTWFTASRPLRSIGAMAMDEQFHETQTTEVFDLLVYIDETSATRQLGSRPKRSR